MTRREAYRKSAFRWVLYASAHLYKVLLWIYRLGISVAVPLDCRVPTFVGGKLVHLSAAMQDVNFGTDTYLLDYFNRIVRAPPHGFWEDRGWYSDSETCVTNYAINMKEAYMPVDSNLRLVN
ncbi:hypothetical protein GE061_014075 [Apolygus lucorum]|uniref:Uncharacterized protein n=1 Tax=Apolygus lucorum TaxID=248454 RepID=A0A8S9XPH5_APOLU|nr:hypothetical protein GE061_014075 [Apolygus lucorum]